MAVAFDFALVSKRVQDALHNEFGPNVAVRTDEGWHGRVHVKIVSDAFNERTQDEKQARVWEALRRELKEDAQAVALVLAYGMDEI